MTLADRYKVLRKGPLNSPQCWQINIYIFEQIKVLFGINFVVIYYSAIGNRNRCRYPEERNYYKNFKYIALILNQGNGQRIKKLKKVSEVERTGGSCSF